MQYLTDWLITLAREYLIANELTVEQIAQRAGYSSPNAFAAAFRRHVGLPPAAGDEKQQPRRRSPSSVPRRAGSDAGPEDIEIVDYH